MCLTMSKYSLIRFLLTNALRYVEQMLELFEGHYVPDSIISEANYWASTLDLVRNCLYDCDDEYDGEVNILDAVKEIREEMVSAYSVMHKHISSVDKVYIKMQLSWKALKEIEELLK